MTTVLVQSTSGIGITARARQLADGKRLRAPHHSCSDKALLSELALAAGGVLYLDEVLEFPARNLRVLFQTWCRMDAEVQPLLVLGIQFRRPDWLEQFPSVTDLKVIDTLPPIDAHEIVELELTRPTLEVA
jgi:hypothetical protein